MNPPAPRQEPISTRRPSNPTTSFSFEKVSHKTGRPTGAHRDRLRPVSRHTSLRLLRGLVPVLSDAPCPSRATPQDCDEPERAPSEPDPRWDGTRTAASIADILPAQFPPTHLHSRIHWEREPQTSSRILHRYNVLRARFLSWQLGVLKI